MTRTSIHRRIPVPAIACALIALAFSPAAAGAQDEGAEEKEKEEQVVVVNVHTESTTTTAAVPGLRQAAYLLQAITGEAPGDLLGDFVSDPEDLEALEAAASPVTETMDYVIYLRPEEFRLEAQGFTMLWRAGEMWFTDPRTGVLTRVPLNRADSLAEGKIDHDLIYVDPMPGAQTRGVSGHLTRGYDYGYSMYVPLHPGDDAAEVEVVGEAWIARNLPEAEQIATFYRAFASAFDDQHSMMGGQATVMAKLSKSGVPLETKETSTVYMSVPQENGDLTSVPVMQTEATTTVTSISTVPLRELEEEAEAEPPADDLEEPPAQTQVPGGQPPDEPPPCDCSCTAFKELQNLDEDDPDAMAKAMCAQQCMAKWIGCAKP